MYSKKDFILDFMEKQQQQKKKNNNKKRNLNQVNFVFQKVETDQAASRLSI